MDHSSAAEQRATAVAKLKRAASLPRMQNGRRPPMHVEAVSEGERSQVEEREAGDGLAEVERGRGGRESLVNGGGEEAGELVGGRDVEPAVAVEAEGEADADVNMFSFIRTFRSNNTRRGLVVPLNRVWRPVEVIPKFKGECDRAWTCDSAVESAREFYLNCFSDKPTYMEVY